MLTADAARRIGRAVAKIERGDRDMSPTQLPTGIESGEPLRICKTTAEWARDTEATLQVWESGTPPSETQTASETVKAINKMRAVAANVFVHVALAANGTWYLVDAGDDEGACNKPTIGGRDLTKLPGYAAGATQALIHESGCMKWLDIEECPESPA